MNIDVPFNGDFGLVEKIKKVINPEFTFLLYGNLPQIISGRPNADIYDKKMEEFIEKNASLYKGLINKPAGLTDENVLEVIGTYVKKKVLHYTITSVSLARKIKEKYPEVKLTLGVYAFIEDFPVAERDATLFDSIVIPHYFANRNRKKLEEYLSLYGEKAVIFLNQICRFGCTEYKEHSQYLQKRNRGQNFYFLGCSLFLMENPLIGVWYRPEDVPKLIAMGFRKFKIINRKDTTENILYKIYHYTNFKPTDNLFRLIRPQVKQIESKMQTVWDEIHRFNTKTKVSSQDLPEDWFEKTMNCTLEKCNKTCFYCNKVWEEIKP